MPSIFAFETLYDGHPLGGCTFFNPKNLFYCEVCGRVRPDLANIAF